MIDVIPGIYVLKSTVSSNEETSNKVYAPLETLDLLENFPENYFTAGIICKISGPEPDKNGLMCLTYEFTSLAKFDTIHLRKDLKENLNETSYIK